MSEETSTLLHASVSSRKIPTREDIHELRNWMLAAQLSLAEVKEQLVVSNLDLESMSSVELALFETIALLKKL